MGRRKILTDEERKVRRNESSKKWQAAHPELVKSYSKKWYCANREHSIKTAADWRKDNPERSRENMKKWRAANSEHVKEFTAKWKADNAEHLKKYNKEFSLKNLYGLSVTEFNAMLVAQNSRCAICNSDTPGHKKKTWCVDHCHKTNVVRGLVCNDCNVGLGRFKDDPALLQAAIDYLKAFTPAPLAEVESPADSQRLLLNFQPETG